MQIIQVDTKPEKLGRRAKVDLGYCGDIKSTLEDLMPLIDAKTSTDFLDKTRSLHQNWSYLWELCGKKGSEKIFTPNIFAHFGG